jgi:hypothetical protein
LAEFHDIELEGALGLRGYSRAAPASFSIEFADDRSISSGSVL